MDRCSKRKKADSVRKYFLNIWNFIGLHTTDKKWRSDRQKLLYAHHLHYTCPNSTSTFPIDESRWHGREYKCRPSWKLWEARSILKSRGRHKTKMDANIISQRLDFHIVFVTMFVFCVLVGKQQFNTFNLLAGNRIYFT